MEKFLIKIEELKNTLLTFYHSQNEDIQLAILIVGGLIAFFILWCLLKSFLGLFIGSSKSKSAKAKNKRDYDELDVMEEESVSEVPLPLMETAPTRKREEGVKKKIALTKLSSTTKADIKEIIERESDRKLILIVDDSKLILNQLKRFLSERYEIMTADSGFAALDKIENSRKPHLILSDIEMPPNEKGESCDGFELLRILQESIKYSNIPVILMTANLDIAADKGFAYGASGFLSKPLEKEIMLEQIEYCLNN